MGAHGSKEAGSDDASAIHARTLTLPVLRKRQDQEESDSPLSSHHEGGDAGRPVASHPDLDETWSLVYSPLQEKSPELRLLKILPCVTDDDYETLRCTLVTDSLDMLLHEYIAISYVWGDPNLTHIIMVDDHPVSVTTNLEEFLLRYRKMSVVAKDWDFANWYLWVDAICINQVDIPEKSAQVRLMGDIFRSATVTFSWLGPDEDDSHFAAKKIHNLYHLVSRVPPGGDVMSCIHEAQTHLWQKNQDSVSPEAEGFLTHNRFWDAASRLFQREYWQRAWVAQEMVVSKDVILFIGETPLHLYILLEIWWWMFKLQGKPRPSFVDNNIWSYISTCAGRRFLHWEDIYKVGKLRGEVEQDKKASDAHPIALWRKYILITRILQSTDPRDKLWSVIGLVGREASADYGHSVESVYTDFAVKCIEADANLSTLRLSGHCLHALPEYPPHRLFVSSWVPNWDALSKEFSWGHIGNTEFVFSAANVGDWWQADGKYLTRNPKSWTITGGTLTARGVICDAVDTTHRINPDSQDWFQFCEQYLLNRSGKLYPTGISTPVSLMRMFFLDRDIDDPIYPLDRSDNLTLFRSGITWLASLSPRDFEEVARLFAGGATSADMYAAFTGLSNITDQELDDAFAEAGRFSDNQQLVMSFANHQLSLFLHYWPFITVDGYLGWGPQEMRAGDIICVVFGCSMPVVLRKVDDHYIHLGACYMLGIMDGEVVDPDVGEWRWNSTTVFEIV